MRVGFFPTHMMASILCLLGTTVLATSGDPNWPYMKPGSAGAGYSSKKLRMPRWEPVFEMAKSTVVMPCNYSGFYDLDALTGFGYIQFDWSNNKDVWVQDKPMTVTSSIAEQAALAHAKFPGAKIGVYRNGIKAVNMFETERKTLDDPSYSGWFVPYHAYPNGGWQKNHSCKVSTPTGPCASDEYSTQPCTYNKCSGLWHDQTQVPQYHKRADEVSSSSGGKPHYDNGVCAEECDCGKQPCGNYVWNHRNASFAEWFVSNGGPIINNQTMLAPGVVSFYIDDSFWHKSFKQGGGTGGVTETSGLFANDTGMTFQEVVEFAAAYEANMERLYDNIVGQGAYVWQLFQDGPGLPKSATDSKGKPVPADKCLDALRTRWCLANGTSAQSGVLYSVHPSEPARAYNDSAFNELATAEFLLTRGNWGFIGTDWNGCSSSVSYYPRMAQWDEDFGTPLGPHCVEVATSGVFTREWSKASVTWDCHAASGTIKRHAE